MPTGSRTVSTARRGAWPSRSMMAALAVALLAPALHPMLVTPSRTAAAETGTTVRSVPAIQADDGVAAESQHATLPNAPDGEGGGRPVDVWPPGCSEIIVDDESPWQAFPTLLPCTDPDCPGKGFYRGGPASGWYGSTSTANTVYGRRATFTYGTSGGFSYYRNNWARWVPSILEGGLYEVRVHVARAYTGRQDTGAARYLIQHADGVTSRTVSQQGPYGWVSLGTYRFHDNSHPYVELRDVVADGYYGPTVVYDAMKWSNCGATGTPRVRSYLVNIPEGATVQQGARVDYCFDVSPAGTHIRWTYCHPEGCILEADWVDDGRGDCRSRTVTVGPGVRTIAVEALSSGRVVASHHTWFQVADPLPPPDTPVPPDPRPVPTPEPTVPPKPPAPEGAVLFVHGYQGLFGPQRECITTPRKLSSGNHFGWLSEAILNAGFAVYLAEWETGPDYTGRLTEGAECLSRQVNALMDEPTLREAGIDKVTVLAHSMGGLVARRYLESALFRSRGDVVDRLITLGTPHQGIRAEDIELAHRLAAPLKWKTKKLEEMCAESPGICDLVDTYVLRYNRSFPTNDALRYYALAGVVDVPLLSSRIPGPDDGVVSAASAEGVPRQPARVARYQVPAAHIEFPFSDLPPYTDETQTICTVLEILGHPLPSCGPWTLAEEPPTDGVAPPEAASDGARGPGRDHGPTRTMGDEELVALPDIFLELEAGAGATVELPLEGYGASLHLRWSGGDISFLLTSPSGTDYDESSLSVMLPGATVQRHPLADGGLLAVELDRFEEGTWLLRVSETGGEPTLVLGFGSVRSAIRLEVSVPDAVTARAGALAIDIPVTARVTQGSSTVLQAVVVAEGRGVSTVLNRQPGGHHAGTLSVPAGGERISLEVGAEGSTASGSRFQRSVSLLLDIAEERLSVLGRPTLVGRDLDGNGLFEDLLAEVRTTCAITTTLLEATLRAPDGSTIAVENRPMQGSGGICLSTLAFEAAVIVRHGQPGPYSLDIAALDANTLLPLLAVPRAAESEAYRLDRFEWPEGWPTPARPVFAAYLPSATKGRAVKLEVAFGDGVDDAGRLLNRGVRFGDIQRLCARQDWYDATGRRLRVRWYRRQEGAFQPIKPDDGALNPDFVVVQGRGASVQCLEFYDFEDHPVSVPAGYYKVEIAVDNDAAPSAQASAEVIGGPACGAPGSNARMDCVSVAPHRVSLRADGEGGMTTQPIVQAVTADGRSVVAWSDTEGRVHVTPVGADAVREGPDWVVDGTHVRGLAARDDWFAVVVRRGPEVRLARVLRDGTTVFSQLLLGGSPMTETGSKWADDTRHEGRLAIVDDRLAVYLGHAERQADGTVVHGTLLWQFDLEGNRLEGGWDLGCRGSLDVRLAYNGRRIGATCLVDDAPKGIRFDSVGVTETVGALVRNEPSASADSEAVSLGGMVPTDEGFLLGFASPADRTSSDVGLIRIGDDASFDEVTWITGTPGSDERGPHLARAGNGFLVGWRVGSTHYLQLLDGDLSPLWPARPFEAPFADRDDFVSYPDGDVGWAHAWGDRSLLRLVRITP